MAELTAPPASAAPAPAEHGEDGALPVTFELLFSLLENPQLQQPLVGFVKLPSDVQPETVPGMTGVERRKLAEDMLAAARASDGNGARLCGGVVSTYDAPKLATDFRISQQTHSPARPPAVLILPKAKALKALNRLDEALPINERFLALTLEVCTAPPAAGPAGTIPPLQLPHNHHPTPRHATPPNVTSRKEGEIPRHY